MAVRGCADEPGCIYFLYFQGRQELVSSFLHTLPFLSMRDIKGHTRIDKI